MLSLRTVRGPLQAAEEESILADYNRLTGARIPLGDFRHWVRDSPEGPAWHAILQTDEGRIVGHFSVIPLRAQHGGNNLIGISTGVAGIANGVNGDQVGTSGSPLSPHLGGLLNNGGPTSTRLPGGNSPALGAGNPAGFLSTDTDQRGSGFLRLRWRSWIK